MAFLSILTHIFLRLCTVFNLNNATFNLFSLDLDWCRFLTLLLARWSLIGKLRLLASRPSWCRLSFGGSSSALFALLFHCRVEFDQVLVYLFNHVHQLLFEEFIKSRALLLRLLISGIVFYWQNLSFWLRFLVTLLWSWNSFFAVVIWGLLLSFFSSLLFWLLNWGNLALLGLNGRLWSSLFLWFWIRLFLRSLSLSKYRSDRSCWLFYNHLLDRLNWFHIFNGVIVDWAVLPSSLRLQ